MVLSKPILQTSSLQHLIETVGPLVPTETEPHHFDQMLDFESFDRNGGAPRPSDRVAPPFRSNARSISNHLIETVGPRPAAGAAELGSTVSIK